MSEIDYDKMEQIMRQVANDVQTTLITKIAKESSKEAVIDILLVCGIDAENPREMQELMAYGRKCKANAERTDDAVKWVEDAKKNRNLLKTNIYAESAKVAVAGFFAMIGIWAANMLGIMK